MTSERLKALHEIRDMANELWFKLFTDQEESDHSLNFIDRRRRRDYRQALASLTDDITWLIHDELGIER